MRVKIRKWGNSLAVCIPKALATQAQLRTKTVVEISRRGNKIIVAPINEPELTLEDLLAQITDENLHGEFENGYAVGNEIF
jgi:antitoxin MazE